MKILILILAIGLFSCHNESAKKNAYNDSIIFYADKMRALTDSGYSQNDSIRNMQKTRMFIYKTMWEDYMNRVKALK